jgi:hypothetical protein
MRAIDFAIMTVLGVNLFEMPNDLLLAKYLQDRHIPLCAAIPCLFQHIGELSTGLSTFFYQASYFRGDGVNLFELRSAQAK